MSVFKSKFLIVTLAIFMFSQGSLFSQSENSLNNTKVLVFSKTNGYRHGSIGAGQKLLFELSKKYNFKVDTTENSSKFSEVNLKQYKVVIFLNPTGNVLNDVEQIAFERYIQAGGGFVGLHAAADCEYDWPWYGKLVGGYFMSHPGGEVSNVQKATMHTVDNQHISTKHLPHTFERTDEFYDFKNMNPAVKTLVTVDENTYKQGKMGELHPMAWYHDYDGGRAFYTNFGHTDETFAEPAFIQHFLGGLQWAAAGAALDYSKAKSEAAPEENRFTKIVLDQKLDEPTELAILNDGRVIYTERKGKVKLYDPKTNLAKTINEIPVFNKFEYGLMGVNIDPNFDQNKFVYLYYSPIKGDTAQHLSRFRFDEAAQSLDLTSEKVLLTVPVKRTDCCHTGGSIAWDKMGNLYVSTGDDTNPFASEGFSPSDNRAGREGWDAQYTSSNTNDLRGKILRIKPTPEGGYTIPEGNLFPVSNPENKGKARPEIYVMGNRNPYRISVDQRNGYLYWGEVGPDAGETSAKFGPRGHDEHNQARKAGYFGWPLFVADNKAYNLRDFADTTSTRPKYDPLKPINDSPHNTGLRELPPAQKAFIYYPYAESLEFGDMVGKGGRNAMGGPVYYFDDYADSKVKFPRYYDGKYFAYDWMRDWVRPVTMEKNGDFVKMEKFLPNNLFSHPMDMAFGKDGALYMLEYGPNWFAQNDEAILTRIEYNAGNRKPNLVAEANTKAGALPLKVKFSTEGTKDPDNDNLSYLWNFGNGKTSTLPNPEAIFTKAGNYDATVKVTDAAGNSNTKVINILAGNDVPKINLTLKGNQTFYWPGEKLDYAVNVQDKEDGSLLNKKIKEEDVYVNIDFLDGFDKTTIIQGHQLNTGMSNGKRLIELSDCKSCHAVEKKSIGPAYLDISKKYRGQFMIEGKLSDKIIKGGGGVWGEQAMSAHPQISKQDAGEMVKYILSLSDPKKKSLPVKGTYATTETSKNGSYLLSASYTDRGAMRIAPQTNNQTIVLRNSKIKANTFDTKKEIMNLKVEPLGDLVIPTASGSFISFEKLDLTNIGAISMGAFSSDDRTSGGNIEVHLGSPTGIKIGEATVKQGPPSPVKIQITPQNGFQNVFFVFVNADNKGKPLMAITDVSFEKAK